MIQEMDTISQGTESVTLIEEQDGKVKEDSESDKDLYLFSLNESLQIHKEMVERVQGEKDDVEEECERVMAEEQAKMAKAKQVVLVKQQQHIEERMRLETIYNQLKNELELKECEFRRMEGKFQSHLKSAKATEDDLMMVQNKFNSLLNEISDFCGVLEYDNDDIVSWSLSDDLETVNWWIEAWMMQVIIEDILDTPIQPGVEINNAFGKMYEWVKKRNVSWATRIRQQMTTFMTRQSNEVEVKRAKDDIVNKIIERLNSVVMNVVDKEKVKDIVERAVQLNLALKSQDAVIDKVTIEEGNVFDANMMISVSGEEGGVSLVISPPFMVKNADHRFILIPAKVYCTLENY
ncbi:hypothetical protein RO3G_09002 [Rhizopus delemar RA 99-880]|uniref:Uncharacterized protein n=1 Tax=Rhizopus delemar (strain RA 99-880 / ATCC MYA-4621 / FGSC 9543 / NRRL 43880) TaxID=246409 RepID=I1C762_RHIO9|nr:hypothetical protein RO3G_09002 [Rhizopus delemar RA 99-880]|eukprot:EIE84292.1 hypothetical protein RO3G_09002 [Rhizopus delemar RA 99-880]